MLPRRFLVLVLALLTLASPALAQADDSPLPRVHLITVGPGTDLFSLWGHVALCLSEGELVQGRCLDFGVATTSDPAELVLGTLRGEPLFQAVELPAREFLAANQWRDVWTQELAFDPESHARVVSGYHAALSPPLRYAYEPVLDNCATRVRDLLDRATDGKLGVDFRVADGAPRRLWAEEALSGRALPLFLLALSGNSSLDEPSSAFERMAFPQGLREGVEKYLGAAPSQLHTRVDEPPPTSRNAGKIVLILFGLGWGALVLRMRKRSPRAQRLVRIGLGLWLASLSLVPLVGWLSALPSLKAGYFFWLLGPTDALLGVLHGLWLERYLKVRLLTLALLAIVLTTIVSLALVPVVVAVALPLLALELASRSARSSSPSPSPEVSSPPSR